MVYNSIANLQLICKNGSSAELTFMQSLADYTILGYNSSPNTSGATLVEAQLVYAWYHNAHMNEPVNNLTMSASMVMSTDLNDVQKQQLDGAAKFTVMTENAS